MTLTSTVRREARPAAVAGTCPDHLLSLIRAAVRGGPSWVETADLVADALRAVSPEPADLLPASLRRGDPAGYQSHLLHAEPGGSFSVSAMVWRPGQQTPVHDHVAWCVTAVRQGQEYEEIFTLSDGGLSDGGRAGGPAVGGRALRLVARNVNPAGSVSGFAPPGDIHRVRNTGDTVAISLHVYGTDISRLGTSIRREYALPIIP
jgi:predicted metal-dependent enzyme (double-stranded beta helix superfamily)